MDWEIADDAREVLLTPFLPDATADDGMDPFGDIPEDPS